MLQKKESTLKTPNRIKEYLNLLLSEIIKLIHNINKIKFRISLDSIKSAEFMS